MLGINGVPAAYAGSNYMNAIVNYVNLLHANGMYALVNIFWAAPGTTRATGQPNLLDQDHGPAALTLLANTFKNDPSTILGVTEEPITLVGRHG
jgi:endoglucanase